jgi:hypothetical protein
VHTILQYFFLTFEGQARNIMADIKKNIGPKFSLGVLF